MILNVENLSFSYKDKEVFNNLSLKLEDRTICSILGPNGIGKTTFIKCLLGINKDYTGNIYIEEKNIKDIDTKTFYSIVAYLKQGGKENSVYTVLDTVILGLASEINPLLKPKKSDIEKVDRILKELNIYNLRDKYVSRLSGGEAQMVYMARALIRDPKILILDEPESNLDYRNQLLILSMIEKLKNDGKIIIFNTHYPEHALRFSDKTMIMSDNFRYIFGDTKDIITKENIENAYKIKVAIGELTDEKNTYKDIIPLSIT